MKKSKHVVLGLVLLIVGVVLLVGMLTFAAACGPKDDGSWMVCHWAGQALIGAAVVAIIIAVLRLVMPNAGTKQGLSLACIPLGILIAAIPNGLINLCMVDTMHCHLVTQPFATIMGVALIIVALADALLLKRSVK